MRRCLFATVFALCFSASTTYAQTPDSCLKLLLGPEDPTWINPDSVKADSCTSSPTYGQLYAKQWFHLRFNYYLLSTPVGPADTILDRTWQDIDTNYANVRNGFDTLEQRYGSFFFRKLQPHVTDTGNGAKLFMIHFNNYVNVDSAVLALKNVPHIASAAYDNRIRIESGAVASKEDIQSRVEKLIISRSSTISLPRIMENSLNASSSPDMNFFTVEGKFLFKHLYDKLNKNELFLITTSLPTGNYMIAGRDFAFQIIVTD